MTDPLSNARTIDIPPSGKPATRTDRPESISGEEFLKNLHDSGLFPDEEIRKTQDAFPDAVAGADGAGVAAAWVSAGKLTTYQSRAIVERRFSDLSVGNYDVLDLLGSGGMGTVFKARHRRMKRVVALKVLSLKVAEGTSFVQRFQREVETIAQLNHPNIVMAYDADEAEAGHFLVMEFVNGRDLTSEVDKNGPMTIAEAVSCILQAARGLEYAHARGIIHRDIKPGNLLYDDAGLIKVADLGLARLTSAHEASGVNPSLTQAGGIVGTPDFMPPEQAIDSTTIDHRADIYSLGCTLFYLLTGRVPYKGNSLMALLLEHRDAPIPDLCAIRPGVPVEVGGIFWRMVAKRPAERYQSMTEVVAALEAVMEVARAAGTDRHLVQPEPQVAALQAGATVAADSWGKMASQAPTIAGAPRVPAPTTRQGVSVADLVIVLVEPSRAQAAISRKYLQELGINKIHPATSGKQALELTKQMKAHAILSSMYLSDMTGLDLAEAIHGCPDCSTVGVVLATSGSEADETGVVRKACRAVLMPKPFDPQKLAQALAEATGVPVADLLSHVSATAGSIVSLRSSP
jgi:serine/threonine-protein kinase